MNIYHYTPHYHARNIIIDRLIKREGCNSDHNPKGVLLSPNPVVWFSTNPDWEATATKYVALNIGRLHLTRNQQAELFGCCRVVVPEAAAPTRWDEHRKTLPTKEQRLLIANAYKLGARPSEWRISYRPVPADKWLAIEELKDGHWVDFDPKEFIARPLPSRDEQNAIVSRWAG